MITTILFCIGTAIVLISMLVNYFIGERKPWNKILFTLGFIGIVISSIQFIFNKIDSVRLQEKTTNLQNQAMALHSQLDSSKASLSILKQYPDSHALYQDGKIVAKFRDEQPPINGTSTVVFPTLYEAIQLRQTSTIMLLNGVPIKLRFLKGTPATSEFSIKSTTIGGFNLMFNVVFQKENP